MIDSRKEALGRPIAVCPSVRSGFSTRCYGRWINSACDDCPSGNVGSCASVLFGADHFARISSSSSAM